MTPWFIITKKFDTPSHVVHSLQLRKVLWTGALLFLAARPASAQWQRIEMDAKGGVGQSIPSVPHPLQFFLSASPDRDPSNSLCRGCKTADGQAVGLNDFAIRTSKQLVGLASAKAIYQIELSFEVKKGSVVEQMRREWEEKDKEQGEDVSFQNLPPVKWKSIVMQSAADSYKELYLLIDEGTYVQPLSRARLLSVGNARILATTDPASGNGGQCTEGYWVLEPEGPWLLDFTDVYHEIAKLTPPDATATQTGCWALSMEQAEVRSPIQLKNAQCHVCGYVGTAVVHFKIEGHRAIPVSSQLEQSQ